MFSIRTRGDSLSRYWQLDVRSPAPPSVSSSYSIIPARESSAYPMGIRSTGVDPLSRAGRFVADDKAVLGHELAAVPDLEAVGPCGGTQPEAASDARFEDGRMAGEVRRDQSRHASFLLSRAEHVGGGEVVEAGDQPVAGVDRCVVGEDPHGADDARAVQERLA